MSPSTLGSFKKKSLFQVLASMGSNVKLKFFWEMSWERIRFLIGYSPVGREFCCDRWQVTGSGFPKSKFLNLHNLQSMTCPRLDDIQKSTTTTSTPTPFPFTTPSSTAFPGLTPQAFEPGNLLP